MWHVTRNIIVKEFVANLFSTMRWEPVTMVIPNIEYISVFTSLTLENLLSCVSKPWLKCQSTITENIFFMVSVLKESIEITLKWRRNRAVISFLPPPGGPMADTSS